jgi:hypothetical protein
VVASWFGKFSFCWGTCGNKSPFISLSLPQQIFGVIMLSCVSLSFKTASTALNFADCCRRRFKWQLFPRAHRLLVAREQRGFLHFIARLCREKNYTRKRGRNKYLFIPARNFEQMSRRVVKWRRTARSQKKRRGC